MYAGVIPAAQHRTSSKLARKTNHIERFNNTIQQWVSRLVRDALSFFKLANHLAPSNYSSVTITFTQASSMSEHYMECTTVLGRQR